MNSKLRKLIIACVRRTYRLPFVNSLHLRGAKLEASRATLLRTSMDCQGRNNVIRFEDGCMVRNCRIYVRGDNNQVCFHKDAYAKSAELWLQGDNNRIEIGKDTSLCGQIHLACIEGTAIEFGEDCLCSSEIVVRTGDSHSILDEQGNRTNPSMDVTIGDHVWIGHRAILLKGAHIPSNSIVGTAAVVTKRFEEERVCLAGVPARVVKRNVFWKT